MSMRIGFDISPLQRGHAVRGVGFYTRNLQEALKKEIQGQEIEIDFGGLKQGPYDLAHYPYFDLFYLTLPLKKIAKTVVTVHDVIPLIFPQHSPSGIKGKIRFEIQKFSLRGTSAVITDSENSRKDIIKCLSYPENKIHVVYLAPGENFKKLEAGGWKLEIRKKYGLPERFVLYVGDVNWNKNVLGLAEACKKVGIQLVIVGKQAVNEDFDHAHIENQPLVQLLELYGEDPDVLRLGFVPDDDLTKIYNLATIYCQLSFYEGFGLPVLEAMSCGCPVVSSNTSSLPEICGEAAILVDPKNPEEITGGLTKMLESKTRQIFVHRGFEQAKKFSWEKTAKGVIDVYKEVVNQ